MGSLFDPARQKAFGTLLCGIGALVLTAPVLRAGEHVVDINQLVAETQKQTAEANKLMMVWWMPEAFWRATLTQGQAMTAAGADQFLSVLRPYVLVAVVDGSIGPLGGMTFMDQAALASTIRLVDGLGARYSPFDVKDLTSDARNLSAMMRPVLSSMIGQMGENMHFFFFPSTDVNGDRIADAAKPGGFAIELGQEVFRWKLPLGSVLPRKVCPEDGETMNGAWNYCPWHGTELVHQKSEIEAEDQGKDPSQEKTEDEGMASGG